MTTERQRELLHIARTYCVYDTTLAIRQRIDDPEDLETMVRIVNSTYDDDAWAMYCAADTAVRDKLMDIIEGRVDRRAVTLTEEEWTDLTTYILITTKHRVSEAEAWEKLAAEKCPDGSPRFPNAADNATFWREMTHKLERIRKQIDR